MSDSIKLDGKKLENMWVRILELEKENCYDNKVTAIGKKIMEIIDEEYRKCY